VATEDQCRAAIEILVDRLAAVDGEVKRDKVPDRTIGCTLLDLDVTYVGELKDGELVNVRRESGMTKPQLRLILNSDDLIELTEGRLKFAHAWATGRVRLDASLRDLFRLRALA
jgi:hypothetical protein